MNLHGCRAALAVALCVAGTIGTTAASAADSGVARSRVLLKISPSREKLQFRAADSTIVLPAAGGADDPGAVGATLEIFSAAGASASYALPTAGWTTTTKGFSFSDRELGAGVAGLSKAKLVRSRSLKLSGKTVGFSLDDPQGSVAVRLTIGTTRFCAMFAAGTVSDDGDGEFRAANDAATLSDCTDETLASESCTGSGSPTCGGACLGGGVCGPELSGSTCRCVQPSSPCGETSPVCNGTCGAGQSCVSVATADNFSPDCLCIADGATPCGSPAAPRCGGECEAGDVCQPIYQLPSSGGGLVCSCGLPGACGVSGLGCLDGFACGLIPGSGTSCLPMTCGGSYPTCGGSCGDGGNCAPIDVEGVWESCVCADPAGASCDTCGGVGCGAGDVCRVNPGLTSCGCELP